MREVRIKSKLDTKKGLVFDGVKEWRGKPKKVVKIAFFWGTPGAGKTTLVRWLSFNSQKYSLVFWFSKVLKAAINRESNKLLEQRYKDGYLLDDDFVNRVMKEIFDEIITIVTEQSRDYLFLIDGFPRTPTQLNFLVNLLFKKIEDAPGLFFQPFFVEIEIPKSLAFNRLTRRKNCPFCEWSPFLTDDFTAPVVQTCSSLRHPTMYPLLVRRIDDKKKKAVINRFSEFEKLSLELKKLLAKDTKRLKARYLFLKLGKEEKHFSKTHFDLLKDFVERD